MKLETNEIDEFIKRIKKAYRPNLFTPIFFSIVFIGVMIGTVTDPDLELWKIILEIVLSALLSFVFWLNYFSEKKKERQMSLSLENIGQDSANTTESDHLTSDEMVMVNFKVMAFYKSQVFFAIGHSLFAILIVVIPKLVGFPTWAVIVSIVLWVTFFIISGFFLIKKHKELTSYLTSLNE